MHLFQVQLKQVQSNQVHLNEVRSERSLGWAYEVSLEPPLHLIEVHLFRLRLNQAHLNRLHLYQVHLIRRARLDPADPKAEPIATDHG